MKRPVLFFAGLLGVGLLVAGLLGFQNVVTDTTATESQKIRIGLPPDPNALPLFILEQRQDDLLPGFELELVSNPAGDPSAMRAMLQGGRVDFAFFNLIGGVRFIEGGLEQLELVAPWVWQGIYLLTPMDSSELEKVDGRQVFAAPGLSTPPHVVTERALRARGIEPKFASAGAGMALQAQARDPQRAPAGIAAPEPLISLILHRQEAEDWEQQWTISLDPTKELEDQLGVRVPLGAIWSVGDQANQAQREALMAGLEAVIAWLMDPENHEEAAKIAAQRFDSFFNMPIPEAALLRMLRSERVKWKPADDPAIREAVAAYLREVFDIEPPVGLFSQ